MATERLQFVLMGDQSHAAADALVSALAVSAAEVDLSKRDGAGAHDAKIIDPVSLAALILSIPGAALATSDLVDRVTKRRKAQAVIEAARRAKIEMNVDVMLLGHDGASQSLASLEPDALLEAASSRSGTAPPASAPGSAISEL